MVLERSLLNVSLDEFYQFVKSKVYSMYVVSFNHYTNPPKCVIIKSICDIMLDSDKMTYLKIHN